jgi:CheY-like chemotaxis protein
MTGKLRVLLVDDDNDERHVFATALKRTGLNVDLFEATDGYAAINYLLGNEPYADRAKFPHPDMVFLDLKMPGLDGFDVLSEIRAKLGLQNLPVIVFTNSSAKKDGVAAYSSHASAVHQKPFEFDHLVSLLQRVIPLWVSTGLGLVERKSTGNKEIPPFLP